MHRATRVRCRVWVAGGGGGLVVARGAGVQAGLRPCCGARAVSATPPKGTQALGQKEIQIQ